MNLFRLLRDAQTRDDDAPVAPGLISPLQRLRQRTGSDQAGLFVDEQDAFTAAMTLARKWGERHRRGKCGVVLASGGRFDPLIESMSSHFNRVPFNDLAAMDAAVDANTVAIVLEPIQREAVVIPASVAYVKGVEKLCRELNILLILNEARGTVGQFGGLVCEDAYGVCADIVVLGDHSNRSPRSAALLARGHACTTQVAEIPGCIPEPVSARPSRHLTHAKPQRQATPAGLTA